MKISNSSRTTAKKPTATQSPLVLVRFRWWGGGMAVAGSGSDQDPGAGGGDGTGAATGCGSVVTGHPQEARAAYYGLLPCATPVMRRTPVANPPGTPERRAPA